MTSSLSAAAQPDRRARWKLRQAGLDVLVMDGAIFPRDKVCAGWITPQVVTDLELDTDAYRRGRTFQPITGFRVGLVGGADTVDTRYGRVVSFGIRRCEFDHYLLQRAGVRVQEGTPITSLRRDGHGWIVNESVRTPILIGAGGHFCPVARWLNGSTNAAPLVVAQETEFPIDPDDAEPSPADGEVPELYFCRDLKGYGWCVRKQNYLNVGLGRLDRQSLPAATAEFVALLRARGRIPSRGAWRWRGHAYAIYESSRRRVVDSNVLLVGDAAGLAYAQSGEGIRPAIESGLIAAATIVQAQGRYTRERLDAYQERLRARFATGPIPQLLSRILSASLGTARLSRLLEKPAFVRHVVLDRWFLHRQQPALASLQTR